MADLTINIAETGGTKGFGVDIITTGCTGDKSSIIIDWDKNVYRWFSISSSSTTIPGYGDIYKVDVEPGGPATGTAVVKYGVNHTQCKTIEINRGACKCENVHFSFTNGYKIPSGGTAAGTVVGSYNLNGCSENKITYAGGLPLQFTDGKIKLAEAVPAVGSVKEKYWSEVIYYDRDVNTDPCFAGYLFQEAYPCTCDNVGKMFDELKKSFPYEGTNGAEYTFASGKTSCGYLSASTTSNMVTPITGSESSKIKTTLSRNGDGSYDYKFDIIIKTNETGHEVSIPVDVRVYDKDGNYLDCPNSLVLTSGSYCDCSSSYYVGAYPEIHYYGGDYAGKFSWNSENQSGDVSETGITFYNIYFNSTAFGHFAPVNLINRFNAECVCFKIEYDSNYMTSPYGSSGSFVCARSTYSDYLTNVVSFKSGLNLSNGFTTRVKATPYSDVVFSGGEFVSGHKCNPYIFDFVYNNDCTCNLLTYALNKSYDDDYQTIDKDGEGYDIYFYGWGNCNLTLELVDVSPSNKVRLTKNSSTSYTISFTENTSSQDVDIHYTYRVRMPNGSYCVLEQHNKTQGHAHTCDECSYVLRDGYLFNGTNYTDCHAGDIWMGNSPCDGYLCADVTGATVVRGIYGPTDKYYYVHLERNDTGYNKYIQYKKYLVDENGNRIGNCEVTGRATQGWCEEPIQCFCSDENNVTVTPKYALGTVITGNKTNFEVGTITSSIYYTDCYIYEASTTTSSIVKNLTIDANNKIWCNIDTSGVVHSDGDTVTIDVAIKNRTDGSYCAGKTCEGCIELKIKKQ